MADADILMLQLFTIEDLQSLLTADIHCITYSQKGLRMLDLMEDMLKDTRSGT